MSRVLDLARQTLFSHTEDRMKKVLSMFLFVAALGLVGSKAMADEMTVSAAASLKNAFGEMKTAFEAANKGTTVQTNFAASNPLLKQIVEGAPVDVFASADEATMDKATDAKVVDTKTRKTFAKNDLVLIVPKGATKPANLNDLSKMNKIAIGNPDSVPAGRYAREALTNAKLWETLQSKYILGTNVRQVLDYVARGEVDAGIVYGTDAKQQADKVDVALVCTGHTPVTYPIAVATTGKNAKSGQKFVDFVLSEQGQAILAKYGFVKP